MLTKLYNQSFESQIFEALRHVDNERERLIEPDMDALVDRKFQLRYKKSSTETIYFIYDDKDKMMSDWFNFIYLLEACRVYNPDKLDI